ncbi:MAG: tetratricopeptide repeat protein, partial [Chitinophagales bacterium]
IGYSLYQQEQYVDALEYFELTRANLANNAKESGSMEASVYADATLRAGDAHFIQKNYPESLVRYNQVITNDGDGTDYAYYQKGMLLGLTGEPKKKIDEMFTLTKRFPSSNYNDDALYQIALTQVSLENYPAAIKTHQKLIDEYPESAYVRKALVNLGLIHFNTGDYKRAMQFYEL